MKDVTNGGRESFRMYAALNAPRCIHRRRSSLKDIAGGAEGSEEGSGARRMWRQCDRRLKIDFADVCVSLSSKARP